MHGVSPADRVDAGLREPDVADLAFGHQFGNGADGVLDRGVAVDAMLVVEVDIVGVETSQRSFDGGADVRRAAVEGARATTGVGDHAEFRCEHNLLAAPLQGSADEFLIGVGPVDFGGVNQGDAQVECAVDGADGLDVVAAGAAVRRRHAHRAHPDARYVEVPQLGVLHIAASYPSHTDMSSGG